MVMPTTFNWLFLGNSPTVLDPTEGNFSAENAGDLVTQTFGSAAAPLYQSVTRVTTIDNGGVSGALDQDNSASSDQFITDIGNGTQTFTFDGVATYNATLTYTDGSTGTILAIVAQDTDGNLFLAPPFSSNADVATLEARPIESVTLDSLQGSAFLGLSDDRQDVGFDDGIVQGTGAADLIDAGYVEPVAFGSDRVDNDDAPGGGDADVIEAGGGNDTVFAGLGNDTVSGGSGDDLIYGGPGDDSLLGGTGDDVLYGDGPAGGRWDYEVYTQDFTSANGQAFTIEDGALADSGSADAFDVRGLGQAATGQGDPDDFGVIYTSSLFAPDDGTYRFETTSDDGSTIRILDSQGNPLTFSNDDGSTTPFMDNDFHQAATTRGGEVDLEANTLYTIEVRFWENQGNEVLSAEVTPPGGTAEDLATSDLVIGADSDGGDDVIDGGDGADLIFGGGGNDTIVVGQGDTVFGGDGDDLFVLTDRGAPGDPITITGGEGEETGGDTLDLGAGVNKSDIILTNTDDAAGGLSGTFTLLDGTLVNFSEIENIICFTPGIRILTPRGERPIETLRVGDPVITRDHGTRPVRWIGRRTVPGTGAFAPVRLAAVGDEGVRRPLLVSPQHRMLFAGYRAELLFGCEEVLVAAKHLIDGHTVTRAPQASVTYIHLMFDRHEVIFAEGIATESFHAGDTALAAVAAPAREELFMIFPELRSAPGRHRDLARPCIKAHEARLLHPPQPESAAA